MDHKKSTATAKRLLVVVSQRIWRPKTRKSAARSSSNRRLRAAKSSLPMPKHGRHSSPVTLVPTFHFTFHIIFCLTSLF